MTESRTVAFFSYTRSNDRLCSGLLSQIRALLEHGVEGHLGRAVEVFQDTDDIIGGEGWRARLDKALREALYLIPIITPSFFNSAPCREELSRFVAKARSMGRDDLVIPVLWMETPDLRDEQALARDDLMRFVEQRQWVNWARHHTLDAMTSTLRADVFALAHELADRIRKDSRGAPRPAAPAEATAAAATSAAPVLVVDADGGGDHRGIQAAIDADAGAVERRGNRIDGMAVD